MRFYNLAARHFFDGQRFSLATFNETPHLQDAAMVTVR